MMMKRIPRKIRTVLLIVLAVVVTLPNLACAVMPVEYLRREAAVTQAWSDHLTAQALESWRPTATATPDLRALLVPVSSLQSGLLYVAKDEAGIKQVWHLPTLEGGDPRQVTNSRCDVVSPSFSLISGLFVEERCPGNRVVLWYPVDGREPRPVETGEFYSALPQISTDGTVLTYVRKPRPRQRSTGEYSDWTGLPTATPEPGVDWQLVVGQVEGDGRLEGGKISSPPVWSASAEEVFFSRITPVEEGGNKVTLWSWRRGTELGPVEVVADLNIVPAEANGLDLYVSRRHEPGQWETVSNRWDVYVVSPEVVETHKFCSSDEADGPEEVDDFCEVDMVVGTGAYTVTQITNTGDAYGATISPEGDQLATTRCVGGAIGGGWIEGGQCEVPEVWLADLESGESEKLVDGESPEWIREPAEVMYSYEYLSPTPPEPPTPVPTLPPSQRVSGGSGRTHVVRRGDTLWGISAYYCGSGNKWPLTWRATNASPSHAYIPNPHWIYPGQRVKVVCGR